jgi:D-cysteine desulfhydrase family pyridoxal phosphate-dependent enzyme
MISIHPRLSLAFLPTPIHPLPRLSAWLAEHGGPPHVEFWVKRDDQTGLAGGGNKTRKLEFLLADALAQEADTLLTTGAVQSNHCRQTAAAAAHAGLACHLVLGGEPPAQVNGNLLLDQLLGATLHWTTRENRLNRLAELADELRAEGRRPYVITYGGSDPIGARGYVNAMEELYTQCRSIGLKLDAMVVASSSGGTQAGLLVGAAATDWPIPIVGISIDEPQATLQGNVARLATDTAAGLGLPHTFEPEDVWVEAGYLGGGYGVFGELEREAILTLARTEGIILDSVYTARAMGGLLDILRHDPARLLPDPERPASILFWHTGGMPAIFAYADQLTT